MTHSPHTTNPPVQVRHGTALVVVGLSLLAGVLTTFWLSDRELTGFAASLEARTTTVMAARSGRVDQVPVQAGDVVSPGTPVLRLVDESLNLAIGQQQREQAERLAEIERAEAAAGVELTVRRRDIETEIFQIRLRQADLSQQKLNRQVEQIAWQERLTARSEGELLSVSLLPLSRQLAVAGTPDVDRLEALLKEDAAANAAESLAAQEKLCQQRLALLETTLQNLVQQLRVSSGVILAKTRLERAQTELKLLEAQQEQLTVLSTTHGRIGSVRVALGDAVSSGDVLLDVIDTEHRFLRAPIPSREASQFAVGDQVCLLFPGRERRQGLVTRIPLRATLPTGVDEDARVELQIEPTGKLWPMLPIGSQVLLLTTRPELSPTR